MYVCVPRLPEGVAYLTVVQLENTQLAFQGVESRGCVLVSSTLAHATNHTHRPRLGNVGDVLVKTSWVARVEDMQVRIDWCFFVLCTVHHCVSVVSLSSVILCQCCVTE